MNANEVSKKLEIPPTTLKDYEKKVGLNVPRNSVNRRQYTKENIKQLREIHELRKQKIPYKEIKEKFGKTIKTKEDYQLEFNSNVLRELADMNKNMRRLAENISILNNKLNKLKTPDKDLKRMANGMEILNDRLTDVEYEISHQLLKKIKKELRATDKAMIKLEPEQVKSVLYKLGAKYNLEGGILPKDLYNRLNKLT